MNNMRMLIETEKRIRIEVREIECVPKDADMLIFFAELALRRDDVSALEESLSKRTGKKCVVVDNRVEKIVSIKA